MTKKELLNIISDIPDDFEIAIKIYTNDFSKCLTHYPKSDDYDVAHSDKKFVFILNIDENESKEKTS